MAEALAQLVEGRGRRRWTGDHQVVRTEQLPGALEGTEVLPEATSHLVPHDGTADPAADGERDARGSDRSVSVPVRHHHDRQGPGGPTSTPVQVAEGVGALDPPDQADSRFRPF